MKKVAFGGFIIRGYEIISFISKKPQTSIAKAKKDNKFFLLKFTKKNSELNFISNISCSTIISPIEYFYFQRFRVLVFELGFCDLYHYLQTNQNIPINITIQIMEDCFQALYYLHYENIIHHDIKLENIILFRDSNESIHSKIISFSGAKNVKQDEYCKCHYCTNGYFGPEFHQGHSYPTDVYSLGVTLRYLWSRTMKTGDSVKIIDHILHRMVAEDPKNRITAQECYSIIYYNVCHRNVQAQNASEDSNSSQKSEIYESI